MYSAMLDFGTALKPGRVAAFLQFACSHERATDHAEP
jgi:hypothetical protein